MANLRQQLQEECGTSTWTVLKAHHRRGALVLVAPELDIIEVAMAVVQDQKNIVEPWIQMGKLTPFPDALAEQQPDMTCLIAQPWVLVQKRPPE